LQYNVRIIIITTNNNNNNNININININNNNNNNKNKNNKNKNNKNNKNNNVWSSLARTSLTFWRRLAMCRRTGLRRNAAPGAPRRNFSWRP